MPILPFRSTHPQIDPSAFIAPQVVIIGDVVIGPEASIWPGCILRGDVGPIRIGAKTNIQDGTIIHVTYGAQGTHIGNGVTVGHCTLLHDCTVEDGGFVGMRATMLDGARVAAGGMLAAGALLTSNEVVETGQVWAGSPAKYWRAITEAERAEFAARADEYAQLARGYR
ncbi:MAG: gamma carbonic anhydrase family protein [Alphaproteobacteria bacterium]|nr:gamma carbonic anhydrase family protein [Alphaproteobacteria bacterium]